MFFSSLIFLAENDESKLIQEREVDEMMECGTTKTLSPLYVCVCVCYRESIVRAGYELRRVCYKSKKKTRRSPKKGEKKKMRRTCGTGGKKKNGGRRSRR